MSEIRSIRGKSGTAYLHSASRESEFCCNLIRPRGEMYECKSVRAYRMQVYRAGIRAARDGLRACMHACAGPRNYRSSKIEGRKRRGSSAGLCFPCNALPSTRLRKPVSRVTFAPASRSRGSECDSAHDSGIKRGAIEKRSLFSRSSNRARRRVTG